MVSAWQLTPRSHAGIVNSVNMDILTCVQTLSLLVMSHLKEEVYIPNPENQKVYEKLYAEYVILHDYFGRGANDVMKRLKTIKLDSRSND